MQAILVEDAYLDITPHLPYEIDTVSRDTYIKLKGSKKKYMSNSFVIIHNGKKISHREAYRQYKIQIVKDKLGIK